MLFLLNSTWLLIAQPSNLARSLSKASKELTAPPSVVLAANLLSASSSLVSKSLMKAKYHFYIPEGQEGGPWEIQTIVEGLIVEIA